MSTPQSAELSLINDSEFLEELGQFDPSHPQRPDSAPVSRPVYGDAFDALESGLPMDRAAGEAGPPHQDGGQVSDEYDEPPPSLVPASRGERQVPLIAAALVIVACLTAGAATAMLVFGGLLTPVTETRPASR